MATYYITAIDTDAGKTFVTGLIARHLQSTDDSLITMKTAQTGCLKYSEDIEMHRRIMNIPMQADDLNGSTCPYVFTFPASPHLAAEIDGGSIDPSNIKKAIKKMETKYNTVLVEGVGGLMVPITKDYLVADLLEEGQWPTILVTSGKLGSINHTLLCLEVMKQRNIPLYGILYNHYPTNDEQISTETIHYLQEILPKYYPHALWGEIPLIKNGEETPSLNLSKEWFQ